MIRKQTLTKPEEIKQVIPLAAGRQLELSRPLVMGILNVTPDSFSDGGRYTGVEQAVNRALQMAEEGADIIDIGGESSRPGAEPVDAEVEMHRVVPVIEALRWKSDVCVSVDTYRAQTARAAIDAGADIVNDISALRLDTAMVELVAERKVPVVLMHMQGTPRNMQIDPVYEDCVREVGDFFVNRLEFCKRHGVDKTKVVLDPGIGFGKNLSHNLELLGHLDEFTQYGCPILVGASRKSFIGMLNPAGGSADQRLGGSLAAAVLAVLAGAGIVRVHDVAETVEALKVVQAMRK
ncbi:MAG: dihydropteroate synthase [candidate division Zixibacteria bacterium]|nr:dihydropteroate synthase [candidate division Zixibacteria bacterium]